MPYVQAGDIRMHYETFGQGTPVLLVAGTGIPGATWKLYQVPALSDRYRVIVYDHRGIGKSDAPDEPYSTRQFAADAAKLLDAIGVTEPAHVIGHSMGGRVCQWLALDHPERVRSMVLAASGAGAEGRENYPRGLSLWAVVDLVERGYREHMLTKFKSSFFFPPKFVQDHPEVVDRLFDAFWENRPQLEPYLHHVIARNQHETGDLLPKINVPTLVMVGAEDTDARRGDDPATAGYSDTGSHLWSSEYLRDHIPGARFALIEGCAHAFLWQKPEEANLLIRDWLDSH